MAKWSEANTTWANANGTWESYTGGAKDVVYPLCYGEVEQGSGKFGLMEVDPNRHRMPFYEFITKAIIRIQEGFVSSDPAYIITYDDITGNKIWNVHLELPSIPQALSTEVQLNGINLNEGAGEDYTVAGSTINFVSGVKLMVDDTIKVIYS